MRSSPFGPMKGDGRRPTSSSLGFPPIGATTTAALFYGMTGAPRPPRDPRPWATEAHTIVEEGLAGLALTAAHAEGVRLDESTRRLLENGRRADARRLQSNLRVTPEILRRLELRNVPVVVTDGPEPTDGSDPLAPIVSDLEVLVPHERFQIAVRTLSALGFAEPERDRPPRRYFDRACREGVHLVREDGASIAIGHVARPWIWGERLPFEELWSKAEEREDGGHQVRAAHPVHRLLIAAMQLVAPGGGSDRGLRMWRRLSRYATTCDPEQVAVDARRLQLDWILAATLVQLPVGLRPAELVQEIAETTTSFADRLRVHGLHRRDGEAPDRLAHVFALPVANAVRFVAGTTVPTGSFLEGRFGSPYAYPRWWRQVLGEAGPRRSGVPSPPRPTRTASLFPDVGPVTAAVLFHDVDGAPAVPTDPAAWDEELDVLLAHRLAGLALAAAERHAIRLSDEAAARLREAHTAAAARALRVESTASSVLESLRERGIPFLITKGPGIALAYPKPSLRPFGDLDVLVPPDRFTEAMGLMTSIGFDEYFEAGEPRSYFDRHCREGVNLVHADGGSIDLHHRVPPWVWGARLPFKRLLAQSHEVDLAGGRARVLDPAHNLLVAALHVISDRRVQPGYKLMTWRDVVSLATACDPEVAAREAERLRLDWYLAGILDQLPPSVRPLALVRRLGHPAVARGDSFRLRRLLPPAIGSKHQIAQVFRLPGPNAAAFLIGYVVPSRGFLRNRYGDEGGYLRWWREATERLRHARDVSDRLEEAR